MHLAGFTPYRPEDIARYQRLGWWSGQTFGDILDRAADVHPDKEALVDDDHRLTYAQLRSKTDRLAIGLAEAGLRPLERVLLQLPNWHEFVVAYFALQKIGAVPVISIARYRQYEMSNLARISGATTWIVPENYHKTDYLPIVDDVRRDNPGLTRVILCRGRKHDQYLSLEELIDKTPWDETTRRKLAALRPDPLQVAHMGPTGGTTGVPKIAPHTHSNLLCKIEYSARSSEMCPSGTCLVATPAAHDLPFANGICTSIMVGGKLVLSNSTDPENICRLIQNEKVKMVVFVPTLTQRVVRSEFMDQYDLTSLEKVYCGGAYSPPDLIDETVGKLHCIYFTGYGGTEGMLTQTRAECSPERVRTTVGRPTCPYDTYKIIDDNGKALPPGTVGQMVIKGPTIFTGYYNMPEENAAAFTEDGFFRTGDLAVIDEAGYITLRGRLKDTIKRGGESIFAPEIENLIKGHPQVDSVAVVGMPDPALGERICAYVKPMPDAELSLDSIISYLKDQKASVLQLPEKLVLIDAMPLTPTGKVDKIELRKDIAARIDKETG